MKHAIRIALVAVSALLAGLFLPARTGPGMAPLELISAARAQEPTPDVAVTLTAFQATVASAGTAELISGETGAPAYCKQIAITPLATNTSSSIGIQSAAATAGFRLATGQTIVLPVQGPLTGIWIDVDTAGDGYSAVAWTN